jgi:hypothetical protein
MSANKANCECKPCDKCKVWEKLSTDPRYRQPVTTRSIGAERDITFLFIPGSNEVVIILPCRNDKNGKLKPQVKNYPRKFTEDQFKLMCCRFHHVASQIHPCPPSAYMGNTQFNWQKNGRGWNNIPQGVFVDAIIDPPFLVAVIRKVIEDNRKLNKHTICTCSNNCI